MPQGGEIVDSQYIKKMHTVFRNLFQDESRLDFPFFDMYI